MTQSEDSGVSDGNTPGRWRRYLPVIAVVIVIAVAATVFAVVGGDDDGDGTDAGEATTGSGSDLPFTPERARGFGRNIDFGPNCDTATGRIRVPTVYAPPCVEPFTGNNGGATHQGVTADTITIASYAAKSDPLAQAFIGGGEAGGGTETLEDYVAYFEAHYETYGRRVRVVRLEASGGAADDSAAKADAIEVATEIRAFASFGGPSQTEAYADELAARGVLCIGCTITIPDAAIQDHAPFLWGTQVSAEQGLVLLAEYIGKRVAGARAEHAGDPALKGRPRRFGLIAYDTPTGTFSASRDRLVENLKEQGVEVDVTVTYFLELNRAQEVARTLVARLEEGDVTSVIFAGDPFMPIFVTKEATAQGFFPEWIVSGSVLTDTTFFARLYDQRQWTHAFGISLLPARVDYEQGDAYKLHVWHHGRPPGAKRTYALIYANPFIFFTGVHLAGPRLTPERFRAALFSYPPTGGGPTVPRISFGDHGLWPEEDYLAFDDATEVWWDAAAEGEDEIGQLGKGMYRYADGGKRHLPGRWQEAPARPFQASGSVLVYEEPPPSDRAPDYPPPAGR
jgi:hypothetical protein